jgi:hypothetical protein
MSTRVLAPHRPQPCTWRLAQNADRVLRTFMLATIAVPIPIYTLMPHCAGSASA